MKADMDNNRFSGWKHSARRALTALAVTGGLALGVTACSGPQAEVYRQEGPAFNFRDYFDGRVEGWGMFIDRTGLVKKRFTMTFDCEWKGNVGTLTEKFVYSDGEKQTHVWEMTLDGETLTGRASDVIGVANGKVIGNSVHLTYSLEVPYEGKSYAFDFSDWSQRIDDRVVINRVEMKKWGFKVGELVLAYRKP